MSSFEIGGERGIRTPDTGAKGGGLYCWGENENAQADGQGSTDKLTPNSLSFPL